MEILRRDSTTETERVGSIEGPLKATDGHRTPKATQPHDCHPRHINKHTTEGAPREYKCKFTAACQRLHSSNEWYFIEKKLLGILPSNADAEKYLFHNYYSHLHSLRPVIMLVQWYVNGFLIGRTLTILGLNSTQNHLEGNWRHIVSSPSYNRAHSSTHYPQLVSIHRPGR